MELIKPSLPTKIEKHIIARQALSHDFVTYLQDLFKNIINKPDLVKYQFQKIAKYRAIRVKERDLFEKVADKYRWPVELEKGQPSLEVINQKGDLIKADFKENYSDVFENILRYEAGQELVLHRCQTLFKNLTFAANLFSSLIGRKINFTGYARSGVLEIEAKEHSYKHHIIIKNVYGLLKCRIDGRIKILKEEQAVFIHKGAIIKIEEIKEPTFYVYYHL